MAALYQFVVTVPDPPDALARAKALVEGSGGQLLGTVESGTVIGSTSAGTVALGYSQTPNGYLFVVTRKPWLVPYRRVESAVRNWFAGGGA